VRASVGTRAEAYDNLDFFASFCVKTKRRKKDIIFQDTDKRLMGKK
jgi:hypothetical protein